MAGQGLAGQGRQGEAWSGGARHGKAGQAGLGTARYGMARQGFYPLYQYRYKDYIRGHDEHRTGIKHIQGSSGRDDN